MNSKFEVFFLAADWTAVLFFRGFLSVPGLIFLWSSLVLDVDTFYLWSIPEW